MGGGSSVDCVFHARQSAGVVELADALRSGRSGPSRPWGFKSPLRHQILFFIPLIPLSFCELGR